MVDIRQCVYLAMLYLRRKKIKSLMTNLINYRNLKDYDHQKLSQKFCKNELICWNIFYSEATFAMVSLMFVNVLLNRQLPMDYEIFFLPVKESVFNWIITYIYQFSVTCLGTLFLSFYWPMVLIVMNHSCWMVESAILHIKKVDVSLSQKNLQLQQVTLKDAIVSFADVIEWQKQARNLLKFDFLLEFSMLSFVICLAAFTVMTKDSDSSYHIFLQLLVSSRLLLYYSLAGSRVDKHFVKLQRSLYEVEWENLPVTEQNDFKLMLIMAQNIRKFHGIFEPVDLNTFQRVS